MLYWLIYPSICIATSTINPTAVSIKTSEIPTQPAKTTISTIISSLSSTPALSSTLIRDSTQFPRSTTEHYTNIASSILTESSTKSVTTKEIITSNSFKESTASPIRTTELSIQTSTNDIKTTENNMVTSSSTMANSKYTTNKNEENTSIKQSTTRNNLQSTSSTDVQKTSLSASDITSKKVESTISSTIGLQTTNRISTVTTKITSKDSITSNNQQTSTQSSITKPPIDSLIYSCDFDNLKDLNGEMNICGGKISNILNSNTESKIKILSNYQIPNTIYTITDWSSFS